MNGVLNVCPWLSLFLLPDEVARDALFGWFLEFETDFSPDPAGVLRVDGRCASEDCGVLRTVWAGGGLGVFLLDV